MTSSGMVEVAVRPVTDEEVAFFLENGWVKLPNLIAPETAARLLEGAKRVLGQNGDAPLPGGVAEGDLAWFRTYVDIDAEDECFKALATAREFGRGASRLLGRPSSIRLMQNSLMVKLPLDGGSGKGAPTAFHQDTGQHMFFDTNSLNMWLALDEVAPETGAVRFYSGSHKLGNLGDLMDPQIWEAWQPRIEQTCSLSDPVHLQAGDATAHTHFTIHGAGENASDRPRWAWGAMLLPGDARYTGAQSYYTDGLGLKPFGPLDHPKFPTIYTPER